MVVPEYTVINLKESPETEMDNQVRIYIGITRDATYNSQPFYRKGISPKNYVYARFDKVILQSRGIEPIKDHKERRTQMSSLGLGRKDNLSKLIPEGSLDGLEEIDAYNLPEGGQSFITHCCDRGIENTKKVLNLIGTLYPEERFMKRYHHIQKKVTVKNNRYQFNIRPDRIRGDIYHEENVISLTIIPL
jgi:hypothetical protein